MARSTSKCIGHCFQRKDVPMNILRCPVESGYHVRKAHDADCEMTRATEAMRCCTHVQAPCLVGARGSPCTAFKEIACTIQSTEYLLLPLLCSAYLDTWVVRWPPLSRTVHSTQGRGLRSGDDGKGDADIGSPGPTTKELQTRQQSRKGPVIRSCSVLYLLGTRAQHGVLYVLASHPCTWDAYGPASNAVSQPDLPSMPGLGRLRYRD